VLETLTTPYWESSTTVPLGEKAVVGVGKTIDLVNVNVHCCGVEAGAEANCKQATPTIIERIIVDRTILLLSNLFAILSHLLLVVLLVRSQKVTGRYDSFSISGFASHYRLGKP
jgi:hypothetical protein